MRIRKFLILLIVGAFLSVPVQLCAVEATVQPAEFYVRLGNSFLESGEYDQAVAMFDKAKELDPGLDMGDRLATAHKGVADRLLEEGKYRKAIKHYNTARNHKPDIKVTSELEQAYLKLGTYYLGEGELEAAQLSLDKALVIAPGNAELRRLLGETLLRKGDFAEALVQFERFVRVKPDDVGAQMKVALLNEKLGKAKEAEQMYNRIIEQNPQYIPAYLALGEYYEKKGKLSKSEMVYRKGIEKVPSEASLHANLAWIYISQENYLDAYKECSTAHELDADNAYVQNYFGLIFMHINRFTDAREAFKKALSLKPNYTGAMLNLAFLYGIMVRNEDAIREYKKVLTAEPDNAEAHYNIGINYKKEGRFLLAQYHLERAAKIYGYESTLGKRALERLKRQE